KSDPRWKIPVLTGSSRYRFIVSKSFQLTYDYQLLGALAIAPNDQKLGIVSVHQQYLSVLAELEQESALQWYYFDVVAKLRQDFEMRVTPALVPNYLARGIGPAVHARRLELEECDRKGKPPGAFGNVLILLKVLSLNETPRVCAGDRLILKPVNIPEFFLEA
ncbi:hypothetical protein B0H14DRAFT_2649940, partial [Mycena olivaceomarginata]